MSEPPDPDVEPDPEERLAAIAAELAEGVRAALLPWTVRCVEERVEAWTGAPPGDDLRAAAAEAGARARDELGDAVAEALAADVDRPRVPPLSLLRAAVRYPTEVLRAAGVPPVVRDEFSERNFPDDLYDLTPANFADLATELHEPALLWGAATAHVHLRRRRAEGTR